MGDRPCVWHQIHQRRAILGQIDALDCYMPPQNWALAGSSAFANRLANRDVDVRPQCDRAVETNFVRRTLHSAEAIARNLVRRPGPGRSS